MYSTNQYSFGKFMIFYQMPITDQKSFCFQNKHRYLTSHHIRTITVVFVPAANEQNKRAVFWTFKPKLFSSLISQVHNLNRLMPHEILALFSILTSFSCHKLTCMNTFITIILNHLFQWQSNSFRILKVQWFQKKWALMQARRFSQRHVPNATL